MREYLEVLKKTQLFKGIEGQDILATLNCLNAKIKTYKKNEYIWLGQTKVDHVGVVLDGEVLIVQEDIYGNRSILSNVRVGDSFAEALACSDKANVPISIVAMSACKVMLLEYRRIVTVCSSACLFHNKMIENMLMILANKNILLNSKVNYISKRTTREKLLAYFSDLATSNGSKNFRVPFDRQALADYLCVERSAMSKELGKMKAEGLLAFEKNEFELL